MPFNTNGHSWREDLTAAALQVNPRLTLPPPPTHTLFVSHPNKHTRMNTHTCTQSKGGVDMTSHIQKPQQKPVSPPQSGIPVTLETHRQPNYMSSPRNTLNCCTNQQSHSLLTLSFVLEHIFSVGLIYSLSIKALRIPRGSFVF